MGNKMDTQGVPDSILIPSIFRVTFTLIEPIMAWIGAVLSLVFPRVFVAFMIPSSTYISNYEIGPIIRTLLGYIAGLYLAFGLLETHLRVCNLQTWRIAMIALLSSDLVHICALTFVVPDIGIFLKVWKWEAHDWCNLGVFYLMLLLRTTFLIWSWRH